MIEILPNSFLFEKPLALPPETCFELISMYESRPDLQFQGIVVGDGAGRIELDIKQSMDLVVVPKEGPEWERIDQLMFQSLNDAAFELGAILPSLQDGFNNGFVDDGYQMQKTVKDGGYVYHADSNGINCNRFMVAIWYLNDGFEGGETEFEHQQVKIKPEAGKLLLFPPWWTHRHRGCPVTNGTKYIATTWLNFVGV
jgi:predicted 2-oxoglutarate/Fe(II)-dependent dioxygenase YbiX